MLFAIEFVFVISFSQTFRNNYTSYYTQLNFLLQCPVEMLDFIATQVINLSHNKIARIPTVHSSDCCSTRLNQRCLNVVDLSDNQLVKFPEQLATLVAQRLDLSRNLIRVVPLSIERKLMTSSTCGDEDAIRKATEGGSKVMLNLNGNPVTCPPVEICHSGTRSIINFLCEAKALLPTYQGLKV